MLAGSSEASGGASGSITQAPNTGAASISDPFTGLDLTFPTPCQKDNTSNVQSGVVTLAAGTHCADIQVNNQVVLSLAPGAHYFRGDLVLKPNAAVDGTAGVVLVFASGKKIDAKGSQNIALKGAKTGGLAGFAIIAARDYVNDFTLPSDNFSQLTGTIYAPAAKLIIDGTSRTGQSSPWTVIVAKGVQLQSSADIVINANYSASDVPRPMGVGDKAAKNGRLVH